jgi:hypothetical protein
MSRVAIKTVTWVFAAIGLAIPIAILLAKAFSPTGFSSAWIFYVWPSYFILGGVSGEVDAVTIIYLIVSILINVALYMYIGYVLARLLPESSAPKSNKP